MHTILAVLLPYRSQWELAILVILTIWGLVRAYRVYYTQHMRARRFSSYLLYIAKLSILDILTIWDLVHAYCTYYTYHACARENLLFSPYLP